MFQKLCMMYDFYYLYNFVCLLFQEEINELLNLLQKNSDRPFCVYNILAPSMSNNIASLVFGKRLKYDDPVRQMMTRSVKEIGSTFGKAIWHFFFPWAKELCKLLGIGDVEKMKRVQQELRDYVWLVVFVNPVQSS